MLTEFADLWVKLIESFAVVFGLMGQLFKHRPWMLPLIPIAGFLIYVGVRARRAGEARDLRRRTVR